MNLVTFKSHLESSEGRLELAFDPDRLRKLRIKRRLTQQQVADLLHIPRQNYQNYEKPKSRSGYAPKGMRTQKLAEILETTPEFLTGQTDDPTRPITLNDLSAYEREVVFALRGKDFQRVSRLMAEEARKQMNGKT